MKTTTKILFAIVAFGFLVAGVSMVWLLGESRSEMNPATFASGLSSDISAYSNIDIIAEDELQRFAYCYEQNKFANAFPKSSRLPKLADQNGCVPAFKLGDDIFILTWKWVNSSAGLAISDSPDFKKRIETLDQCFRVRHISGHIYQWELNLETAGPNENAK